MKNIIMAKEGQSSWVRWIKKRIDNNLNFLAILEGSAGIGKSWNALEIAYEIDEDFDVREQCSFDFSNFMKAINKCNDKKTKLSQKKYKVLIFDEAQTSINKRDWQSKINKLFLYLLSTFRHQNIIVFFTSPYADFMDSASLKLIHAKFECKGWNKKTQKSQVRPKLLQYNSRMQKFYEHSLYVVDKNKKAQKLVNWFVKRPPSFITEPYEEYKMAFTQNLNKQITRELEAMQDGDSKDEKPKGELNPESIQPELWDEVEKGYVSQEELRVRMEKRLNKPVNISLLNRNLQSMRKKGFDDRKFKVRF